MPYGEVVSLTPSLNLITGSILQALFVLRRCLISETKWWRHTSHGFSPSCFPDGSNRLLIPHPQTDQTPLNHDISCPWTPIPHFQELSAQSRPFSQPTNSQVAVRNVFENDGMPNSLWFFSSKKDSIPIIIFSYLAYE